MNAYRTLVQLCDVVGPSFSSGELGKFVVPYAQKYLYALGSQYTKKLIGYESGLARCSCLSCSISRAVFCMGTSRRSMSYRIANVVLQVQTPYRPKVSNTVLDWPVYPMRARPRVLLWRHNPIRYPFWLTYLFV